MPVVRFFLAFAVLTLVSGTPLTVRAQAAPGPFVKQAFDLLMDRFVIPPASSDLLSAAWDGGVAHVNETTGNEPPVTPPAFSGKRGADWNAFFAGYPALAGALGPAADFHALDYAMVAAMARSLNSTHTFISPSAPQFGQPYVGIGVTMSPDLTVTDVFPGAPAEAAGLRLGDRILAVDGVSMEGLRAAEASAHIRGAAGSDLQISVRRGAQAEPISLTITRAEVVVPWVTAQVLDGGIGYLRIRSFPRPEALGEFDAAVAELEGADIKGLVIDVRGNDGGFYETSNKVISRFLPQGPIYQRTTRQGQTTTVNADGSAWSRDIPIALLVNEGTGSGGELLPSALRENGAGYLIGTHTRGSLAGGSFFPLDDGSNLTIAVQAFRSGKGQEIEHVGLEPDLSVELDPAALAEGQDTQLEAALTYLKARLGS